MSTVTKSFGIVYDVRERVETSSIEPGGAFSTAFSSAFDSAAGEGSPGLNLKYDVKSRVSKSVALVYDVRQGMYPSKVLSVEYDVRERVTRSLNIVYGVRVPIGSAKTLSLEYGVRVRVSKSFDIQYDVASAGSSVVSKSLEIRYHTLVTPAVSKVITVPMAVDNVPPQIVTTSF